MNCRQLYISLLLSMISQPVYANEPCWKEAENADYIGFQLERETFPSGRLCIAALRAGHKISMLDNSGKVGSRDYYLLNDKIYYVIITHKKRLTCVEFEALPSEGRRC